MTNSFWQREKGIKKMNSTSFQGLEKPENFRKLLANEEEEVQVQRDVQKLIGKVVIIVMNFSKMTVKVLLL